MEYIKRDLERKFLHMSSAFKAVMVVGARQVGKSTMLKHLAKDQNRNYVTMDDTQLFHHSCDIESLQIIYPVLPVNFPDAH